MELSQVVDIALAGAGTHPVEVSSLESADVSTEMVGSLAQVMSELVQNAAAFSKPGQKVRVNGVFEGRDYLLTISDDGVGIPNAMLEALNRVLASPGAPEQGPNLGISLVARLAARSGLAVQLVPGVPGTTARVRIPERSVRTGSAVPATEPGEAAPEKSRTIDLPRLQEDDAPRAGHVVSVSEESGGDVEAFLERIFGPLRGKSQRRDRPARQPSNGTRRGQEHDDLARPPVDREPRSHSEVSTLRVRVPGQNFRVVEDEPSSASSEQAIDLRVALGRFEDGRREASEDS